MKDTLIATDFLTFKHTLKRKPVATSKFYFFDIGVVRLLQQRRELLQKSPDFGEALATYISHELQSWCDDTPGSALHYWRSTSGYEVDFVLNETVAIEIKPTDHVRAVDLRGIKALYEEGCISERVMVSCESRARVLDGVHILSTRDFLERLGTFGFF